MVTRKLAIALPSSWSEDSFRVAPKGSQELKRLAVVNFFVDVCAEDPRLLRTLRRQPLSQEGASLSFRHAAVPRGTYREANWYP